MKLRIMESMYRLNSDEAGYTAGETLKRKSRKPRFNYITWSCNCALLTAKFQTRERTFWERRFQKGNEAATV